MQLRRFGACALVALAFGSFLVACGDDDDDTTAASGDDTAETTAPASAQNLSLTTQENGTTSFKFDGIPATLKAGVVDIELANTTGKQPHDFQLVKLEGGHTIDEIVKTVSDENSPLETWLKEATGVGTAGPQHTSKASVELTEGTWGYFCTESTDQDDGSSISHAQHGMSGTFDVKGDNGGDLPTAAASVVTTEYKFAPTGLKAGENTVEFRNDGAMLHHVLVAPIAAGKTLDDVKAAFASEGEPQGPPPVDFEKFVGTAVLGPKQSLVTTMNLPAGTYAMFCFMPDPGTAGPPHVAKGMLQELKVG
jgi:hypothetical protein